MGGNTGKLVLVVVLLAVAATIFFLTSREEKADQPKVEQRDMVCLDSGEHFQLGADEYERRHDAAPLPEDDAPKSGPRRRAGNRRPRLIPCEECDGGNALLAAKCKDSDNWYPIINPDGSRGKCED